VAENYRSPKHEKKSIFLPFLPSFFCLQFFCPKLFLFGCGLEVCPAGVSRAGKVQIPKLPRGHYPAAMLRQTTCEFKIDTRGRGLYEVTGQLEQWVGRQGMQTGLLTLHVRHTSASLLIQENADPDVRRDLESFFARLVPDGDPLFVHTIEGDDDMPAHIRTALTSVNLSIPLADGRLTLGTWQGIYLWEHRRVPHPRTITAHLLGE
jgi:secondary thiamine-phosphate synthase enzyme